MSDHAATRFSRRAALGLAVAAGLAAALPAAPAFASDDAVFTNWRGHAIRGYDPVAYFSQGEPIEGSSSYELEHDGATWRFASAENMAKFQADPAAYAPQYGGYCAWAVSQGKTAPIDPDAWKIVDGKLYLNYNASIQERWEQDIPGFIQKADANWPSVLN
ncbi:MAG: YHS domain-containing (seleno)protein [Pseudomonadota bacterium]